MRAIDFVAVTLSSTLGCGAPSEMSDEAKKVRDGLTALDGGTGDWSKFTVTYNDQHGLHGGLKISIYGTGKVEQEAVGEKLGEPREVTLEELKKLVGLLRQHQVWEQRVPERAAVPDESAARLTITYGADSVTIWEWYNERERLLPVLQAMKSFAWHAPVP